MYEVKFLEHFKQVPVFSISDLNQIIKNRSYAKRFLKKMIGEKRAFKIKKGYYTLHEDSFLISSFLVRPSYISSVSALSFYKAITQIPREIFCFTQQNSQNIFFKEKIKYIHTNYFFGYNPQEYEGFKIPIADIEKAIIDSIGIMPIHIFEEAFQEIDKNRMLDYLKKINKSEIVKRIGYLMENHGFDSFNKLKKYINYKYIVLDPLGNKRGIKNKKWNLIINTA